MAQVGAIYLGSQPVSGFYIGQRKGVLDNTPAKLTNNVVGRYLSEVIYTDDYTNSSVVSYKNITTPYRKDWPAPAIVRFSLPSDADSASIIITSPISRTITISDLSATSVKIYNLTPGVDYSYEVRAVVGGATEVVKSGTLSTTGDLRMIAVDDFVKNFRDLGGWQVPNGHIAFGKVYRSAKFDSRGESGSTGQISEDGVRVVTSECGVAAQIDLRGWFAPSPLGVTYYGMSSFDSYLIGVRDKPEDYKEAFRKLLEYLEDGKPTVYGCAGGADRTGTFSFVLEALLGVSESDLSKDYELTTFSGATRTRNSTTYPFPDMVAWFKSEYPGQTINESVTAWWQDGEDGLTAEEIASFKAIMIV